MSPGETILPHYHEIDQFQIFVAGASTMGRAPASPLAVHYVDHYTGYGPIEAGPQGFSFFTLHATRDPGAVYRHHPGYQERLQPSQRRHRLAPGTVLSTAPVLQHRDAVAFEPLFEAHDTADGLGAFMLRMGTGMRTTKPDTKATGGQFYLVVNGSLEWGGGVYPTWSTLFVSAEEPALEACAGAEGLEALILQFPRRDM